MLLLTDELKAGSFSVQNPDPPTFCFGGCPDRGQPRRPKGNCGRRVEIAFCRKRAAYAFLVRLNEFSHHFADGAEVRRCA